MKFKVEIEIDWINEDSTINETVSEEIKHKLIQTVTDQVVAGFSKKISEQIAVEVQKKVIETYDSFIIKPFKVYDKYGDLIREEKSILSVIKSKLDAFMTGHVDKRGNAVTWGGKPRYEYLIEYQGQKQIENFISTLSKTLIYEIKEDINQEAIKRIASDFLSDKTLKKLIS